MDTPPNVCRTQPKVMASKISTNSKKTIIAEQKTCFIALNPFIFHLKTDLLYHRHVFSSRSLVLCRRGTMSCFSQAYPSRSAAASVEPLPANGSRIRPSDRQILQICRMIFSGFTSCAQLGIIRRPPLCLAFRLVVPAYPALSRSFPYTPLCDMECAPPHRQRPTLPGDFACLNPAQRAADKILTKYNAAHWSGQSEK